MSNVRNIHFEAVGSYLRPAELKEARAKFADGKISATDLRAVEDRLITEVIKQQKAHRLPYITDGEFRRSYWHLDFMWGFNGVEHIELEHGYQFHGEETTKGSIQLTGKITGENHPFIKDFLFVKKFEELDAKGEYIFEAKQTVPAPAQFLAELFRGKNAENTRKFYPNTTQLIEDIAQAYRTFFQEIYAAGCRTIQLDDCTWGMIVDSDYWKAKVGNGFTLEQEALQYLKVNNLAIEGKPEGLTINTHVCRGNYHSCYATKGAYDAVAPYLFAHEDVDTFYLEYDDERSGGFEPLKYVADGKKVVLGLVTSKSPVLEDKATVIARIHEAAKYISLNRLSLSPQCGFASCEIGNKLTDAEQWAKIDLVTQTIAQTGTVHEQRHVVLMADSGQRFQLCLGVQGAVLRRVGDVHHAREHEMVHIVIGIEGTAPVLNRPGIQLAVGVRQADDLVARELDGTGLVSGHMAGGCGHHTLPAAQHRCNDDGVALGAARNEPDIGIRCAARRADLLPRAGAIGIGAVAGDLFKVGLHQLL